MPLDVGDCGHDKPRDAVLVDLARKCPDRDTAIDRGLRSIDRPKQAPGVVRPRGPGRRHDAGVDRLRRYLLLYRFLIVNIVGAALLGLAGRTGLACPARRGGSHRPRLRHLRCLCGGPRALRIPFVQDERGPQQAGRGRNGRPSRRLDPYAHPPGIQGRGRSRHASSAASRWCGRSPPRSSCSV